jgi:multiple sugar transport system substrate-binding protein
MIRHVRMTKAEVQVPKDTHRAGNLTRRTLLGGILAGGYGALTGCGKRGQAEGGASGALRFWNGFTGPDGKTMEQLIARFQRENPDVSVRMQIIPWAQYYDKLTLSLGFDQAPDLFICQAHRLAEFAHYQALRPLDDLQKGPRGLPNADFTPLPWQAAHFEGRLYGLPLDCYPMGLYYNRKLFREAGIVDGSGQARPPRTLDEFLDAARRLTRDIDRDGRPDQWGFAITNRETNWYATAKQHGGGTLTPDLRHAALNQPPSVAAMEQLRGFVTRERIAPSPEGLDAWRGFRLGRLAMVLEGIYMLNDLQKTEGLDYGGAPTPQFGPEPATWGGSHMLCMPASIPQRRAENVWRLVRYLSDNSLDWAEGGQTPVRRSLQATDRFRRMEVQSQFAMQLPYVQYDPPSPRYSEIGPFIAAAVEAGLLGMQTPKRALDEAAGRINRVLSRP